MGLGMKSFVLGFVLAGFAHAGWRDMPATEFTMAPPPVVDSFEYRKDFLDLHAYEQTRTKADCDLATEQRAPDTKLFFKDGGILTEEEFNRLESLLADIGKLAVEVSGHFKTKHMRPRPYDTDATLTPCAPKPGGSKSYPSSHSAVATTASCLLAWAYPDRALPLLRHGRYLSDLRALVGVHHPSDVRAGRYLGEDLCERLLQTEEFVKEFQTLLDAQ